MLISSPSSFKNIQINDGGRRKPLLHFVIENMADEELLEILDICFKFDFNVNVQNGLNETPLHVNLKRN